MANKSESTEGSVLVETSGLDTLLADEYVLYMRTRDAGRKIPDESPAEVQQLFEKQCRSMSAIVADVGRAARSLGAAPSFIHEEFMEITRLNGHTKLFEKQNEIIAALLDDHEFVMGLLGKGEAYLIDPRSVINPEEFTADLLKRHEEMAGALGGWLE